METYIIGTGAHAPERVVANEELAGRLGLDAEQIFKSAGIRRRHWAGEGATTSALAAAALAPALEDAGLGPEDVDYLLFGTMTPDRFIPGSAPSLQKLAGLREVPCLDIRATCCNTLYGLQLARGLIASGAARHVALCLAEVQSAWLDLSPGAGTTSMLFGDGAAALIVSADERAGALRVVDVFLATNGGYADDLGVRCPGTEFGTTGAHDAAAHAPDYAPRMNGQSVILQASRRMTAAGREVLGRNGLAAGDVRWVVPHQANANLLAKVARDLGFAPGGDGLVNILEEFGNTSSASMGMALDALRRSGRVGAAEYLLMPAFGAGFTWGAGLCRA